MWVERPDRRDELGRCWSVLVLTELDMLLIRKAALVAVGLNLMIWR